MHAIERKFLKLGADDAPGQEIRQDVNHIKLKGEKIPGKRVDFSHGDVDAFEPIPGALDHFIEGVRVGGEQAYTEYRGSKDIREHVAEKLAEFTGAPIHPEENLIITPGTQGALFLAMGATVSAGDKVAIVEPDYFANRKLVEFLDGDIVPIKMDYFGTDMSAGLDLTQLEDAFKAGVKLFLFSNPNNPTGVIYSQSEIHDIATLAEKYGATIIVDELYGRQVFAGRTLTHLRAQKQMNPDNLMTIIGPSKTESLSGYRVGVAFGSADIIDRMEKLQAIVSLRAGGYSQAVLKTWFNEPKEWMKKRILAHQAIRDDLVEQFQAAKGFKVRATEAGSYLFPTLPKLNLTIHEFTRVLRLQANVIVTPGTEFGTEFTDSFRINFSQNHQAAINAVDRIIQIAKIYE